MRCPLCHSEKTGPFHSDRQRTYLLCAQCDLVFVPKAYHLTSEQEKARYDSHQNDPRDPRYRAYLSRLFIPLKERLAPGAHGLDFGCGPGPGLSLLFEEAGFRCENYDPFYALEPALLDRQYDFLACSETVEHFYRPREEFELFLRLLRPGGWIGIMTQLRDQAAQPFESWYYKNDPTHVCFFSAKTFRFLGETFGLHTEIHPHGTVLFSSPSR